MVCYNYVGTPNSNLVCCICRMPFIEPITTKTCFHTFCNGCISRAIAHGPQCPVDRSPLDIDDLLPANPIVRALVDELTVECPHRSSGCKITCQRQLLAPHLKDACQYTRAARSEGGSDKKVSKNDVESHQDNPSDYIEESSRCGVRTKSLDTESHSIERPGRMETCPSCSTVFPETSSTEHADTCPDVTVACPHSLNGCQWKGTRRTLTSAHLASCPYEGIKNFFALNDSRLSVLTAENIMLNYRVETLEGMVHTLKRELQTVKTTLGPWYRPDGVYRSSRPPISSEPPSDAQPSSSRQHITHDAAAISPLPAVPREGFTSMVSAATADPDILAPYFPPVTDENPPQQTEQQHFQPHDLRARHRHSTSMSHFPDLAATYPHLPSLHHINFTRPVPQTHSSIAPINLGTTLEGSLSSLRESIVTLSASVDSVARQHDLALTNETLKLNEELMSMKASIHGLRMQVHTIMMDRNAQVTGRINEQPLIWGESRGPIDSAGWSTPMAPRFHPPQASPSVTKL